MIYIFMPKKKCPFDLVFPCRNREKCLYCVVWFTSAEFYGFGRRVERKQKGPLPPAPGMFVMKQPPLLLLSLLPVPLNPSEQRAPTVMHTHRYCTLQQTMETFQTWVTVFTEDTDLIACT